MTKEQLIHGVELEDLIVDLENQLAVIEKATELKGEIKVAVNGKGLAFDLEKEHVDFEALKASSIAIITAKLDAAKKEFEAL
ncbi:hypothetical protein [Parapedobacter indicus]|uniref:Uncharacterized protein n=1 Tax=Parapedobacter indicus TaxID=1477437 RepID=A0A1I3E3M7_9SPHI|nr:hypothetical protein [Parapedobacter indicus]PPL04955.1 hypothetical protein CLV26_101766 [Parapedobacter indicus]SFH93597.1 hypothetical protein SAMN05444682_101752 [Parapedobacter indicus]